MERTAIFLDVANLEQAFRQYNAKIDYVGLREYLTAGRFLVDAFAYVPINPHHADGKRNFIDFLGRHGFLVRSKVGKPRPDNKWKCNFDVEMAVDMLRYSHQARVDIVVMGSGDGDMLSVCEEIRFHGIRCEVAATRQTVADDLVTAVNGFIDLGEIIKESGTTENEEDVPAQSPLRPNLEGLVQPLQIENGIPLPPDIHG